MSTHTPGPWQAIEVMGVWMVGVDAEKRLLFKIPAGSIDAEQIAKLAAIAPELYNFCTGMLECFEAGDRMTPAVRKEIIGTLRAILSKARPS